MDFSGRVIEEEYLSALFLPHSVVEIGTSVPFSCRQCTQVYNLFAGGLCGIDTVLVETDGLWCILQSFRVFLYYLFSLTLLEPDFIFYI